MFQFGDLLLGMVVLGLEISERDLVFLFQLLHSYVFEDQLTLDGADLLLVDLTLLHNL